MFKLTCLLGGETGHLLLALFSQVGELFFESPSQWVTEEGSIASVYSLWQQTQLLLATGLSGESPRSIIHLSHPLSRNVFIVGNRDLIATAERFLLPWRLCADIRYIGTYILSYTIPSLHLCVSCVLHSPSVH